MTLSHRIQTKKLQLEKELQKSKTFLESAPEGALICQKTPHGVRWMQKQEVNGTRKYISQKNRNLAEQLALKKYHTYKIQEISEEFYPEQRNIKTLSGQKVRSKSEALIAIKLTEFGIPFHYEEALPLEEKVYYPDFTLRHPETGKFFYWEHFGMMDNPSYAQKAADKIASYATHGIFPFVNFFMTFESKDHPLDLEQVEALIQYYLT